MADRTPLEYRTSELEAGRLWWFGAIDGEGHAVGWMKVQATDDPALYDVRTLRVNASHRGQGIATELHRRAVLWALERGGRLRVIDAPDSKHASTWERLRANRIELEGGEHEPTKGTSSIDRYVERKAGQHGAT